MARPSSGMEFPQASMMFAPGMPPGMHGFMDPAMLGAGFGAVSRQLYCLRRVPGPSLLVLQCIHSITEWVHRSGHIQCPCCQRCSAC